MKERYQLQPGQDSPDLQPNQLLMLRRLHAQTDAPYFIYRGKSGEYMRLSRVEFHKPSMCIKTAGEITIHISQLNQYAKVLGLVAVVE